jgi:hypothetical protein
MFPNGFINSLPSLFNQLLPIFIIYKCHFLRQIWSIFNDFPAWKKPTVRDFLDPILIIFVTFGAYRDLSKNSPHKKHCAWARPPPWEFL